MSDPTSTVDPAPPTDTPLFVALAPHPIQARAVRLPPKVHHGMLGGRQTERRRLRSYPAD